MLAAAAAAVATGLTSLGAFAVGDPHLALDPIQGPPGTTVTATGSGFCASCGPVEIDFVTRPVKQGITVAADGSFQTSFIVPGGAQAGTNAVNAYQQGTLVTQTSFTVTPSVPASPPTATPVHPGTPPPASPTPRVGPSPRATATPTPESGGPSPSPTNAGTSGSGTSPALIVFLALAAALLIAAAALLVYRRLRKDR